MARLYAWQAVEWWIAPLPDWFKGLHTAAITKSAKPAKDRAVPGASPLSSAEIEARIFCCDPDIERPEWLALAAGLHATQCTDPEFDKRALFVEWSRGGAKFVSEEDCEGAYDNMPPKEGGNFIGARTFVWITKKAGYRGLRVGAKLSVALCTGSDVELAQFLKAELERRHGGLVSTEGSLHRHTGSHWEPFEDAALRRDVHPLDGMTYGQQGRVKLSQGRVNSILNELGAMVARPDFFGSGEVGVNCANGFVRFDTEGRPSLEPHKREHRVRHVLSAAWEPGLDWRQALLLRGLLEGCFRDDADQVQRIELIGEIFGAAVLGHTTRIGQPRAFVLHGSSANNGKSQVLDCARGLLPADALVSISPARFSNETMLARLAGALLNTAGELGSAQAIASDVFKSVVTGDAVTARRLYQNPIEFRPRALHLFATNTLPSFQGGFDHGVRRRLMVVPFNRTFASAEMIPNLADRIVHEEIGALLAFTLEGAGRLIRQGQFTEPPSCREALNEWVLSVDPVIAWKEARTTFVSGLRAAVRDLYSDFAAWAVSEGFSGKSLPAVNTFSHRLLAHDGRLRRHKANADRSIVGLRLLPRGYQPASLIGPH